MALLFILRRPLEFSIEEMEELAKWETLMAELEARDVEFEADRVEVVRLVVNPH